MSVVFKRFNCPVAKVDECFRTKTEIVSFGGRTREEDREKRRSACVLADVYRQLMEKFLKQGNQHTRRMKFKKDGNEGTQDLLGLWSDF